MVREADDSAFLRQTVVHRAGHCALTPAETIAAVQALLRRMDTGDWSGLDANSLNAVAAATGPAFNVFPTSLGIVPTPSAYFEFAPSPYLRRSDALGSQCQSDPAWHSEFVSRDSGTSRGNEHERDSATGHL